MIAKHMNLPHPEINLVGRQIEWQALAAAILEDRIVIPCDNTPIPNNEMGLAKQMIVQHRPEGEKVTFVIENDSILIRGDLANLTVLAVNIKSMSERMPFHHHAHIEHLGDYHYVSVDSVPVVLLLAED